MLYNRFQNLSVSALGFGAMRLPVEAGNDSVIDEAAASEMVAYAMAHGINYYDTAWGYHGEQSEIFLGKVLSKYPRDSFYLATKFPGYDLANMDKVEHIFETQLNKCGVDYFDFYLLHNVCEMNIDAYLDEGHGILAFLLKEKENGRIRHLGFSSHGSIETMTRFLFEYGKHMEFGQIQLNYIDWSFQNAQASLELLCKHNIPIWVMEPLRGGKLASLSSEAVIKLKELRPDESISAWAFRFLQTMPNVVTTLSGMSNLEQLQDNIRTFTVGNPLNEQELSSLHQIGKEMVEKIALPCTGCRYCISHCPQKLDIPDLIRLLNEHSFTDGGFIAPMAMMAIPKEKQPSACIGCTSCESVCPQQIKIAKAMGCFARSLDG